MKILFITNIPSPYRVNFFNELGKKTDLTVIFEKKFSGERDNSWKSFQFTHFNGIILRGIRCSTDKAFCPQIFKYIFREFDYIVVTNISSPTGILAILLMRLFKIPYSIEGDGGFAKEKEGIKGRIKHFIISGANFCFSTSAIHDNYYLSYGARASAIIRYPFSSVKHKDFVFQSSSEISNILFLRKQHKEILQIKESRIFLAVGRFVYGKGFDVLLKSVQRLPQEIGFYFVGGEPTQEYLELAKGLENVHFISFLDPVELQKYYRAADFFVLPTRSDVWGLVINEAMSNAIPVITTDKCIAGVELIKDNENGYIVPVGDVDRLASAMTRLIENTKSEEHYIKMALRSYLTAEKYTIESMAFRHFQVFQEQKSIWRKI